MMEDIESPHQSFSTEVGDSKSTNETTGKHPCQLSVSADVYWLLQKGEGSLLVFPPEYPSDASL